MAQTTTGEWPLTEARFAAGIAQLTAAYPPRGGAEVDAAAGFTAYWRVLEGKDWLTVAVWEHALQDVLEHVQDWLPTPAQLLEVCRGARRSLERRQERAALRDAVLALPAGDDPHALTPEQVKDVVWIRNWYGRVLAERRAVACLDERLDPQTLAWQRDCERHEDVIGHIPDLPPEQLKAALSRYGAKAPVDLHVVDDDE